jgi:competence protein ComEC
MHVLAVSGLHVGIIYALLLLLFKPMNKFKWAKWSTAFVSIFILWSYAFITGLSPSVLRAVTMFSFVALGRPLDYRTNMYNTLALSAFVLLLYDPFLIMSVGFQLSYLAVVGILFIHPDLYRMYETKNKVLRWLWQATSISIAAQAATFALGLLYFHQFPNYFIFSNLLVIPLSSLVLIAGLALLAFSFISSAATIIGYCVTMLIKLMNFTVFNFESLPFSITNNIYMNAMQCWLIIALVILLVLMFKYKKFSYLIAAAFTTVVFAGFQWYHFFQDVHRQKISVYKIAGHTAVELIDNGHSYFFSDSSLDADEEKIKFHIAPHRLICGIQTIEKGVASKKLKGCDFVCWNGKNILWIYQPGFIVPESVKLDYLILSNNAVKKFSDINYLSFNQIIIDSSNSFSFAEKILKHVRNTKNIYSVLHQGAFIEEIKH